MKQGGGGDDRLVKRKKRNMLNQNTKKKSQPLGFTMGGPCALFLVFELVVKQEDVCHARPAKTGLLTGLERRRKEEQSSVVGEIPTGLFLQYAAPLVFSFVSLEKKREKKVLHPSLPPNLYVIRGIVEMTAAVGKGEGEESIFCVVRVSSGTCFVVRCSVCRVCCMYVSNDSRG